MDATVILVFLHCLLLKFCATITFFFFFAKVGDKELGRQESDVFVLNIKGPAFC